MIKPVIGRPPAIVEIAVQLLKAEPGAFMGPWCVVIGVAVQWVVKIRFMALYQGSLASSGPHI